ncbi:hypothetical protein BDY17DRAFT_192670 [Neohortaea acidophila]|uniref:Uncharacterized protein n=1 Tax=Neohortaea acidophila TaxID=245834 RepID=A0A6A6PKH4_9PEZI|nr:uncharacterized protein BDY17DRAFT_192670 [Neohortaea acidophila]KAF2480425.1 hypothetical protein BDY17DRAFT_192670 [Neohortaea acidophila]
MASAAAGAARRAPTRAPFLDPTHQRGLTSLLSRTYGKPVHLNLVPVKLPHHDPDILAQYMVQKLRDRRALPRRIVRDAAWKAELPTAEQLIRKERDRYAREVEQARDPLTLAKLTHGGVVESVTGVLKGLTLSQVSSVAAKTAGRLSPRITANRADGKGAIRGTTKKAPTHMIRGTVKANTAHALRAGKRRIGAYGVRVTLGYT